MVVDFSVILSARFIVLPKGGDKWPSLWVNHWVIHSHDCSKHSFIQEQHKCMKHWLIHSGTNLWEKSMNHSLKRFKHLFNQEQSKRIWENQKSISENDYFKNTDSFSNKSLWENQCVIRLKISSKAPIEHRKWIMCWFILCSISEPQKWAEAIVTLSLADTNTNNTIPKHQIHIK